MMLMLGGGWCLGLKRGESSRVDEKERRKREKRTEKMRERREKVGISYH